MALINIIGNTIGGLLLGTLLVLWYLHRRKRKGEEHVFLIPRVLISLLEGEVKDLEENISSLIGKKIGISVRLRRRGRAIITLSGPLLPAATWRKAEKELRNLLLDEFRTGSLEEEFFNRERQL